jgi:K+-sensing histidine kinase KdpD
LASLLAWVLYPALQNAALLVFLGAVAGIAIWAGLVPGLWSTVLSIAAIDFLFLAPRYSLTLMAEADLLLLAVFGGVAAFVSWVSHRVRRTFHREVLRAAGAAGLLERQLEEMERDLDASETLRKGRDPRSSR